MTLFVRIYHLILVILPNEVIDLILKSNFPENLRRIRLARGYQTSGDLCAALCAYGYTCSASTVRSWETGYRSPSFHALVTLCNLLEISADELIFNHTTKG